MCGDRLINRWPRGKERKRRGEWGGGGVEIRGQIRGIQTGSARKGRCEKLWEKNPEGPRGPVREEDGMGWGLGRTGGDGKVCVYVLQEEAVGRGGVGRDTCLDKQWMSQRPCVYVCVCVFFCELVTGEVYFGSAHRLAAKTNSPRVLQGGWTRRPKKINPKNS